MLITVAAGSKACTIFYRSSSGIMSSNPARMDVGLRVFCVYVPVPGYVEVLLWVDLTSKETTKCL
jgi:hypothetical protein